ncbi:MAG: T9SS type A sorting domain-containing protein [Bacteroidota bacterium]
MRVLSFLLVLVLATPLLRAQPFQGLGDLPGGIFQSQAFAVSADGSVVGGNSVSGDFNEAFRWTASGGMEGIGWLPEFEAGSSVVGASADGDVLVGWSYAGFFDGFRWTADGGMQDLFGSSVSSADGVSSDGSVVVGSVLSNDNVGEAFRWTAGGVTYLGTLGGESPYSQAHGVSADGTVVVGVSTNADENIEAFRWTASGGMVGLGVGDFPDGANRSQAVAVSADGTVVVGGTGVSTIQEAFRWTASEGIVGLGDLPGGNFFSIAYAVSADGTVVVGYGTTGSGFTGREAFIWTEADGMRLLQTVLEEQDVDLSGWTLREATGISADGTVIVGYGVNPNGNLEAWRADLSPTARWVAPAAGFFNEPARWSIEDIPDEKHALIFEAYAASPYTVTFVQNQTARALTVDSTSVRFDLGSATLRLGETTGRPLRVGVEADSPSALALEGGTLAAETGSIGVASGSDGVLTLGASGDAASLSLDGSLGVGDEGRGRVEVLNGSTVTIRNSLGIGLSDGSTGTLTVGDAGQLQVTDNPSAAWIGLGGTGTLVVNGSASFLGTVDVGRGALSDGTWTLSSASGEASAITHDLLQVGVSGTGGLEVLDGATLVSTRVALGVNQGSLGTALIRGPGARWDVSVSTRIGVDGAALLQVQDGATVCIETAGFDIGEQGRVETDGTVRLTESGCSFAATSGGSARSGGAVLAAPGLTLAEGAELQADAVILGEGGVLGGSGTLALPITNAGTLAPGGTDSTGVFTLSNDYVQAAEGALAIEFGGTTAGSGYDRLAVTGEAALGGTLRLVRLVGYTPMVGEAYTLLTAAALTGTFDAVEGPPDVELDVRYTATAVTATVTAVTVSNEPDAARPDGFALHAAYPNPFDAETVVSFDVPEASRVTVAVFDVLGREAARLVDGEVAAGRYEVALDGRDLPSGVYVVRMTAAGFARARRVTLLH